MTIDPSTRYALYSRRVPAPPPRATPPPSGGRLGCCLSAAGDQEGVDGCVRLWLDRSLPPCAGRGAGRGAGRAAGWLAAYRRMVRRSVGLVGPEGGGPADPDPDPDPAGPDPDPDPDCAARHAVPAPLFYAGYGACARR